MASLYGPCPDEETLDAELLPVVKRLTLWQKARKLFEKPPHNVSRVSESLDYEPIQNELYFNRIRQRKAKRHVYGYSGLTLAKSIVVIMTGIFTGICALAMAEGSSALLRWRNSRMQALIERFRSEDEINHAFLFMVLYGSGLVIFGGCMVTFWAPSAAGAGVSLVMAYLNGNHIPNLLRFRTLITKVVGTICAVAAGLAVGPEGPLIHVGACVASNLANANCNVFTRLFMPCLVCDKADDRPGDDGESSVAGDEPEDKNLCAVWEDLHEDSEHREFISAGAAAGLSAAFGAPIGGVLFSMEEACSFWSKKVAWRCFLAAILAAFTVSQFASHGDTPIRFENVRTLDKTDQLRQIPFMVLVSLIGGLLGATFNHIRVFLWRFRASRSRPVLRILELVLIGAICISLAFFSSTHFGRCQPIPKAWPHGFQSIRFTCPEGQQNDLATMFMSVPDDLLSCLFSEGADGKSPMDEESGFSWQSLIIFSGLYIMMMSLCAGVCIPAGLFMPTILLGAAVGLTSGRALRSWLSPDWEIQPGLYALICATAVLAGVFRSAISVVVVVVEGTRGIDFLYGIIIAVVVANWVADLVHRDGVYESELERDGNVFFLRHEPPNALSTLTAEHIMVRDPVSFTPIASVKFILEVLTQTTHHGFPVVAEVCDPGGTDEGVGQLEGIILRSQLLVMLRERAFCDAQGRPLNATITRRMQYAIEREMRLFYRKSYTHHRHMATRDNDIHSLRAMLAAQPCMPMVPEAVSVPSTSVTRETVSFSENVMSVASTDEITPTPIPELEQSTSYGSRTRDEMQELRSILNDMGCGSLLYLDLRLYMNTAPLTVRKEMSAARVHRTFVTLGMRHLCVTNHKNRIVGLITRKDLDAAAGHGAWRRAALHVDDSGTRSGNSHGPAARSSPAWLKWLGPEAPDSCSNHSPLGSPASLAAQVKLNDKHESVVSVHTHTFAEEVSSVDDVMPSASGPQVDASNVSASLHRDAVVGATEENSHTDIRSPDVGLPPMNGDRKEELN